MSNASSVIRPARWFAVGAFTALALLVGVPAAANASTLYVSEHPAAPGSSCSHAGFKEIQRAIEEADATPGTTIEICGGTYAEQLEITGEMSLVGKFGAKVTLPAEIKDSGTRCDEAVDALVAQPDQDLLSVCTPETVKLSHLTLEAKFPSSDCYDSLYNTMVGGGATLEATKVAFEYAGVEKSSPFIGCQGGVGIEVGVSGAEGSASVSTPAVEVGHAILSSDTITEYQKNGITVDGDGSSATIGKKVTITGDGPVGQGQNGIQVSRGAVAAIDDVSISDNECNIPSVCGYGSAPEWEEDASGVLLYLPGATTTVEKSTLSADNIGVEYISGGTTRPATPELTLTHNTVSGGYASVQINQGNVAMKDDKLTGGLFALDVNENEYGGAFGTPNAYAPDARSTSDYLEGSRAAVQVEASVGELEGDLTLTSDSVVGPVDDVGHPNFKVTG
jgi:hypothetical protein